MESPSQPEELNADRPADKSHQRHHSYDVVGSLAGVAIADQVIYDRTKSLNR